jgi:hypothetical protein
LTVAGSSLGYKHSEEALEKLRLHLNKLNSEKGFKVEVTDQETKTVIVYDSIRRAALALNCDKSTIMYQDEKRLKGKTKLFRNRYDIKIIR